ncbi:MAG: VanZ family protein [Arenicella sp.]|jgi:VanZ family protein
MFTRQLAKLLFFTLTLSLLFPIATDSHAQENKKATSEETLEQIEQEPVTVEISEQQRKANELEELGLAIKKKALVLKSLKAKVRKSVINPELELEIAVTEQQLETLDRSFEQVAIGSINLDVLGIDSQPKTWQEELTLVVKPLLENLRGLTEQPRRKENLRQIIVTQKDTAEKAQQALQSIDTLLAQSPSKTKRKLLADVRSRWLRTKEDAERQEQLALYQLNSLSGGNEHWVSSLKDSLLHFFEDRGLTLLIAIVASLSIWSVLAGLRKIFDRQGKKSAKRVNRTTYRVIAYAQRLLTGILIIIAILTVFFVRGDVLLLVISLALLFASALGLKNLLPQFIAESRLLLNIGAVREHEMVLIDGVPWRVASINLFSKFVNPEIQGTLRLPLASLKGMVSRPVSNEKWFPSSIGDWVLDDEKKLYEVIRQTPVIVELQSAQGTNKLVPTHDYFSAGLVNLTKSKQIRITNTFGVDYSLQSIALDVVPETLQKFVKEHLENARLDTKEIDVRVEFNTASESSLDYLIIALLGSTASKYFYRIERTIQQACVAACNANDWSIPFPQMTIHKGD